MPSKKIVCLGGGSMYFGRVAIPRLVVAEGLAGSEIVLYDIDVERTELVARHGRRLAEEAGTGMKVRASSDLADAVDGADFAISSIGGVGRSPGRIYESPVYARDMLICAKYGIYQIIGDTCGPEAMMMAFRSIPVYMDICREMEKRCPDVVLLNHSNPMAIICRAMIKYTGIQRVVGLCHGVQSGITHIARVLGIPPDELDVVWIGTNHYHWFTRVCHRGKDLFPELKRRMAEYEHSKKEKMVAKLSEIYGYELAYADNHVIEFYPFLAQLPDGKSFPYNLGEEVRARHGTLYEDFELKAEPETSEAERREWLGRYEEELRKVTLPEEPSDPVAKYWFHAAENTGSLIEAIALGRREVYIVNIPNKGSVPNLPDYAVLEVEGVTDSCGVRPVYMGEAPLPLKGILEKRIAWQELVVDAGVKGDRKLALQALLLDEMAILPEKAEAMLGELLENSKEFLPQFFGKGR